MYFSSGIDYTKLLHIKNFVVYLYTKEIRNEYQSVDGDWLEVVELLVRERYTAVKCRKELPND